VAILGVSSVIPPVGALRRNADQARTVTPGNGVLPEKAVFGRKWGPICARIPQITSQIHTSGAFAAAPALRTSLIETSENSARLIGSSRQPASIAARVRLSSKRQARGQHAFEPGAKVSVAERADWILASLAG
jgi:hypothetical protein